LDRQVELKFHPPAAVTAWLSIMLTFIANSFLPC